jgi:DNA-binding NarL/FixJ family response regulator
MPERSGRTRNERAGDRVPGAGLRSLSLHEVRVVSLVADGRSDQEIARLLAIEVGHVVTEMADIVRKLGLRSRTELALLAPGGGGQSRSTHRPS